MNAVTKTAAVVAIVIALGGLAAAGTAGGGRIDINSASVVELTELPGVGPAKAAAIVEERQREPFRSVDDLTRVSGIGERMLDQLRDRISVGGADGGSGARER